MTIFQSIKFFVKTTPTFLQGMPKSTWLYYPVALAKFIYYTLKG